MSDDRFVLDAGALAKLFLEEPKSAGLRAWRESAIQQGASFATAGLAGYELANVARRHFAASRVGAIVLDALQGVAELRTYDAVGPFLAGLSAYDASYLAAAHDASATLVTYDDVLAAKARKGGIAVISP